MTQSGSDKTPIPHSQILEEARLKTAIARQHLDALSQYGMTADWLDELETATNEAERIPTHQQQLGEMKSLTAAKDEALEACQEWGRRLRYRMQLAFEDKTPTGMQFPTKDFRTSERSEAKMIALFPSLLELARQHQPTLIPFGHTEEETTLGDTLFTTLKATNEAQEQYNFTRTTITAQRRQAYRYLYDSINRINQMGQMVYGPDTPDGSQFRSNWNRTTASEDTLTPDT